MTWHKSFIKQVPRTEGWHEGVLLQIMGEEPGTLFPDESVFRVQPKGMFGRDQRGGPAGGEAAARGGG